MVASDNARQPRKDAVANRAHILDTAARVFAEEGVNVSMDALAKHAGIGSATLYRNFPNKDALLAALLAPHHERLATRRIAIERSDGDAGQKLQQWIDALGDWMLAFEGLPEPLREAWMTDTSALKPACDGLIATTEKFLDAAQRDGFSRPCLSGRDVFIGVMALAWASEQTTVGRTSRAVLSDMLRNGWAVG
ncbi:TetR/AcrR family transcriptional regulator [Rhizobium wenxiniae]|nr:TetR/AcrR family transcriptional regulator [Rhizobium wenxiniae]